MLVLGLETSCDETGVALYDTGAGLLAHALFSQVDIHVEYGGVVPELASRDHVRKVLPLVQEVLQDSGRDEQSIDAVAYTAGPGLAGALMVGATLARALAWGWGIPALGVHHMEGHLLAPMLEDRPPTFPFVALLVSGGHTQLVSVKGIGQYELMGESVDDATQRLLDQLQVLHHEIVAMPQFYYDKNYNVLCKFGLVYYLGIIVIILQEHQLHVDNE